jgi:rhamnosyltransferase
MGSIDTPLSSYKRIADSVMGVLVLYKIPLSDSLTFTSLSKSLKSIQVHMDLVIYDNSPKPMVQNIDIHQLSEWRIHYMHDSQNPGVSKAYNEGAKLGSRLNKKWILLLDQDTTFPQDSLLFYFEGVKISQNHKMFSPYLFQKCPPVLLSPAGYKLKRGYPLKRHNQPMAGVNAIRNKTLLSSGLLVDLDLFHSVGGYNESLKLDFSDFYFIDKLRKQISEFYLIDCKCSHRLSRLEETSIDSSSNRFLICCEAAYFFSENFFDFFQVYTYLFFRACKLSFKYKSFLFHKILFKCLLWF